MQGTTTLRAFVYDAAGNMTRDTRGTTQYNYTINAAGRLSEVKVGTQLRATYLYDHKSRLKSSVRVNVTNAGTTRYIHDHADRIIAELDAAGNTLREYIWLDDLPVAVLDGSVNQANPSLFWVHADHLNRPIMMTDAARAIVWRAAYEPFGTVHSITGAAANDNRFPGQWFQLEASLAYNWHRHYDATLGRYTQPDPLGLQALLSDGPSVYGYAGQKPVELTDPTGELVPILVGAAIGAGLDYASHLLRNRCECKSRGTPPGTYTTLGAGYGATGPFAKKPRVGIGGGGPSGDTTSWLSQQASKIHKSSPGLSDAMRSGGRFASRRLIPGLGLAASAYDAYSAYQCE